MTDKPFNMQHGHVVPREDGGKARCGGPGMCNVCNQELAEQQINNKQKSKEENEFWGWHLIVNVRKCRLDLVKDPEYLAKWVKNLVYKIDMVAYGEPQVVHFGHGEPHLAGNTVIQLIETSNIMAHFCDAEGDAYIDVFSCKKFDSEIALQHIEHWFHPESMNHIWLTRKA